MWGCRGQWDVWNSRFWAAGLSWAGQPQNSVYHSARLILGIWIMAMCGRVIPALSCPSLSHSSAELCEPASYSSPCAGRIVVIPTAGNSRGWVSSLKWCVLANCHNENHNSSLEFSQSCCTNACVLRRRKDKFLLASISPPQENDCCDVHITSPLCFPAPGQWFWWVHNSMKVVMALQLQSSAVTARPALWFKHFFSL